MKKIMIQMNILMGVTLSFFLSLIGFSPRGKILAAGVPHQLVDQRRDQPGVSGCSCP